MVIKTVDQPSYLDLIEFGEFSYDEMPYMDFISYPSDRVRVEIFVGDPTVFRGKITVADYCENVTDRMFLLGINQLNNIYDNREILGSDYLIGELRAPIKLEDHEVYKYPYWTRCPFSRRDSETISDRVYEIASISYASTPSDISGVRPAFYIDNNISFSYGDGTESNPYTVATQVANTILDETILKAKICQDNAAYQFMRDGFENPSTVLAKNLDLTAAEWNEGLTNFIKYCKFEKVEEKNYYELVLLDAMTKSDASIDRLYKTINASKELNDLFSSAYTIYETSDKIEEFLNETYNVEFDDSQALGLITGGIFVATDTVDAMRKKLAEVLTITKLSEEWEIVLTDIYNTTSNRELQAACEELLDFARYMRNGGIKKIWDVVYGAGSEQLNASGTSYIIGVAMDFIPAIAQAKAIVSVGQILTNNLFNADALTQSSFTMAAIMEIDTIAREILADNEAEFSQNPTFKNAGEFMAIADFCKDICIYGCDVALQYTDAVINAQKNQNAFVEFQKIIPSANPIKPVMTMLYEIQLTFGKSDANELKDTIQSIRDMTAGYPNIEPEFAEYNGWHFYNPYGNDIAKYLRNIVSTTPSEWAKPYINKAISYHLLPEDYQNNYQNNITRAEFCTLISYLIDSKTDESIEDMVERLGKPRITVQFDDTLYVYVNDIARLGIINGTGNNKFEPLGEISREQAAKMLCETAKVLGYNTSVPETDLLGVSDWAKEGVNFVVNTGIMTGTDNGFEPNGTYTKEQAITTFVRFYENLNR